MVDLQDQQRGKLEALWRIVYDDNMERMLEKDAVVPASFLAQNGIVLLPFDIEKTDAAANSEHNSPILFKPASRDFFQQYPIDVNAFTCPLTKDLYINYHKRTPEEGNEGVDPRWWPKHFTDVVYHLLNRWAYGEFPRHLPEDMHPYLPDNFGMRSPRYELRYYESSNSQTNLRQFRRSLRRWCCLLGLRLGVPVSC